MTQENENRPGGGGSRDSSDAEFNAKPGMTGAQVNGHRKLTDYAGHLLVIKPRELLENVSTAYGVKDAIHADAIVIYPEAAPELVRDLRVFQARLVNQLRPVLTAGQLTLGRLRQEEGENGAWTMDKATAEESTQAREQIKAHGLLAALLEGAAQEEPEAPTEDSQDPPGSSWGRMDLDAYLDGNYVPIRPDMLLRTDGHGLMYRGKIHSFHGESESGKSLVLQWEATHVMRAGEDVLWLDFDSDPGEVVGRFRAMGVPVDVIRRHLDYRKPEEGLRGAAFEDMFSRRYGLAVIDGVTDVLSLFGEAATKGDPNDKFTAFSRSLPRRLTKATGAAVALVDHVAKDRDSRGRFAIGAQSKMSQLDGAAYVVDVAETFGRGMRGVIVLKVAKDRPGGVRPHSGAPSKRDRTQEAARVVVDDTGPLTVLTVLAPAMDPFETVEVDERPTELMAEILKLVTERPGELGKNDIRTELKGQHGTAVVDEALRLLEESGQIVRPDSGRKRPYTASAAAGGAE